jgi:hypothetical protein
VTVLSWCASFMSIPAQCRTQNASDALPNISPETSTPPSHKSQLIQSNRAP